MNEIIFDKKYFQEFPYTKEQINQFFSNATKDFRLAKKSEDSDIIYRICYDAVIKLGIALIAKNGYKIRSIVGHHVKILEYLGKFIDLKDEIYYLNKIRQKRNVDLYDGGIDFTDSEAQNFLDVVSKIFLKANIQL